MENQKVKRGQGRPRILTDHERKRNKMIYMLNTEWFCEYCDNNRNYTLAGKSQHLRTKKHRKAVSDAVIVKINDVIHRK